MATKQLERAIGQSPVVDPAKASILKSILVHVDIGEVDERLETALSLARAASGHLSCIHVTPVQAYVAFDTFGGIFVMDDIMKAIDEQTAELRAKIEGKLALEDVTWDFEEITGDIASSIIGRAALADLVVVGRQRHHPDFATPSLPLMGDLLHRCRTPLLVAADGARIDPAGTSVIAWDGSYEAANAVRSSLGLLRLAEKVVVLQIVEDKPETFPGTRILEYLSRHDIHAELIVEQPAGGYRDQQMIAASLVGQAARMNAAYLVMGGYSHSRVSEFVFGGVTRTLLKECPIALVLAH